MHGGRLAYKAQTDDWRVMPKPLAATAWAANEQTVLMLPADRRNQADAQILPAVDYTVDYQTKASDKLETHIALFRNLIGAREAATRGGAASALRVEAAGTTNAAAADSTFARGDAPVAPPTDAPAGPAVAANAEAENTGGESARATIPAAAAASGDVDNQPTRAPPRTSASIVHTFMQRSAGLPVLLPLQAVMILCGGPLLRATRQAKNVSLSASRILSKEASVRDGGCDDALDDAASEPKNMSTIAKYYEHRRGQPTDARGMPTTLYRWLKSGPHGTSRPIVLPSGVNIFNFGWPMDESWARCNVLLHTGREWKKEADAKNGQASWHDALLEVCALREAAAGERDDELHHTNATTSAPIGLISLVRAAHATKSPADKSLAAKRAAIARAVRRRDQQEAANEVARALGGATTMRQADHLRPTAEHGDTSDSATEDDGEWSSEDEGDDQSRAQGRHRTTRALREAAAATRQQPASADLDEDINLSMFRAPPAEYNSCAEARKRLLQRLAACGVDPDTLTPRPPPEDVSAADAQFEAALAAQGTERASATPLTPVPQLQEATILKLSRAQRAGVATMILPFLDEHDGAAKQQTLLLLLGEAGSGKSEVMRTTARLLRRLRPPGALCSTWHPQVLRPSLWAPTARLCTA
jgi:hypothetical protein